MAIVDGKGRAPDAPELMKGVKVSNESCTKVGRPNAGGFAEANPGPSHRVNASPFGKGSTYSGSLTDQSFMD